MSDLLREAREREVSWSADRHARVRSGLSAELAARTRRRRAFVAARSGLVGVAVLALVVRALGAPEPRPGSEPSSGESAPRVAYDDAGFHGDVVRD